MIPHMRVGGWGGFGAHFPTRPPPLHMGSRVCLLTMRAGGLRRRRGGAGPVHDAVRTKSALPVGGICQIGALSQGIPWQSALLYARDFALRFSFRARGAHGRGQVPILYCKVRGRVLFLLLSVGTVLAIAILQADAPPQFGSGRGQRTAHARSRAGSDGAGWDMLLGALASDAWLELNTVADRVGYSMRQPSGH